MRPSPIDGLFTGTQRRLLRLLFGEPDRAFCVRELRELAGTGSGATQRELDRLERAGLVSATQAGARVMVQADKQSPIHDELAAMVRKTVGLAEPLREALSALAGRIELAFAFEPERDPRAPPSRELGILLVMERPDALSTDLLIARDLAEQLVGRSIWMMECTPEAFRSDAFVAQILERPRVWVIGDENALMP